MIDAIKRTLLAGVGAAVITKEKAESALGDLVARGKVTTQEARRVAERLARDGRREFDSVSADISTALEQIVEASANRTDAQLRQMRSRVQRMKPAAKTPAPRTRRKTARARRGSRRRLHRRPA
ncbi:MAG TPA: hypothetical protein VFJ90_14785 [Candidatus Didemnitutus sp.]|nr:hypothetical protein [Candidatus Didemnitutus sp.]